jgi:ribosomal protein S18 acetylase RimI-like enzyme
MIGHASLRDKRSLEELYAGSVYRELPMLVRWALQEAPDRISVLREGNNILASAYVMICDYGNLWSSYLAFKHEEYMKQLIDRLLHVRNEEKARNLYVFCLKEYVDVRVHLILRGFVPECIRSLNGAEHIVEVHDGSLNPTFQLQRREKLLPVSLRRGKTSDVEALAEILHQSLRNDFPTERDAARCVEKWLKYMAEYIIVAEHEGLPVGVALISPEIYPVLDKDSAMLCYLAVEASHRGRGIGKSLVKEACSLLRLRGKRSMEVDVGVHNIPARIFYTKVGFYPFWLSRNYMPHDDGVFYRIDF